MPASPSAPGDGVEVGIGGDFEFGNQEIRNLGVAVFFLIS
jgi:hypothetical protein